jgi:hypothetical protein
MLILIVLGGLFWTDHALALVPVHILVGFVLVFSLWALAVVAARPAYIRVSLPWPSAGASSSRSWGSRRSGCCPGMPTG